MFAACRVYTCGALCSFLSLWILLDSLLAVLRNPANSFSGGSGGPNPCLSASHNDCAHFSRRGRRPRLSRGGASWRLAHVPCLCGRSPSALLLRLSSSPGAEKRAHFGSAQPGTIRCSVREIAHVCERSYVDVNGAFGRGRVYAVTRGKPYLLG